MLKRHAVWVFGWYLGTWASGPHVKAARRLGLRLVPGYASLRPACGSSAPSGASAAACCHRGTRASGPHVEAARRLELRLPPAATGVRGPPARMWKRRAVWGFGCRLLSPGYAGLRPACAVYRGEAIVYTVNTPSSAGVPPAQLPPSSTL